MEQCGGAEILGISSGVHEGAILGSRPERGTLIGTSPGVSKAQLQVYLDEFVFRHDRRKIPADAFQSRLGLGTAHKSTKYEQIKEPGISTLTC